MARSTVETLFKKNSKLESFLKKSLNDETYERVRAYESCIIVSEKENKALKYAILGDEWIYLTENPPKNVVEEVSLKDIISVDHVNDYPDFLSGEERENTQHLVVTYWTSDSKRRSIRRSKRSPRPGSAATEGDRKKFGKGVRQRSVRSDNTKVNAGTLPLVLYKNNVPPLCSPINLNHHDSGNITSTDDIIIIHHVGEVLACTINDVFCIGKIVESVKDASETCKVLLYKERDQPLEFHCEPSPSSVPCAFISKSLNISGQDIGAVYIMDDDKFNELNIHRHTEHVSVEEELNEIENVFEAELVVCDNTKTHSGRRIGTPKYLWDYY
ncbi:unnamed protein product [Mytilus coruscus]|uniref:Uncharacterized protein n=1 Tax=Mytilus coruscus TaxID=42192 RepID=A0A6J8EH85_MYTCO|nr:unnamed protein product [Mytilus coruscus]